MADDRAFRCELAFVFQPVFDEGQLAELLCATMQPEIQSARFAVIRFLVIGNHQPIRLHRAIDL